MKCCSIVLRCKIKRCALLWMKWSALASHHMLFYTIRKRRRWEHPQRCPDRQEGKVLLVGAEHPRVRQTQWQHDVRRVTLLRTETCCLSISHYIFIIPCTDLLFCILIQASSVLSLCLSHMPLCSGVALSCSCFPRSPPLFFTSSHTLNILHPLLSSLLKISSCCLMIDELLLIVYAPL